MWSKESLLVLLAGTFLGGVLSYWGMGLFRSWAERRGMWDIPNYRSSHTQPMPRGGGLLIVLVALGGWAAYGWLHPMLSHQGFWAYLLGAALVAGVSWYDDLRPSRALGTKLCSYCAGALLGILGFGYWHSMTVPLLGEWHLGWLGPPITFLWIVGLTNAFNFLDGLDGLAASQAVVIALGWLVLGLWLDQPWAVLLALLLIAGSLGFLGFNWPPARIFMGDVGSTFLGYTFAVLPLLVQATNTHLAVGSLLLVWPAVFVALFTFIRRLLKRENVFLAHRSFLFQRLVIVGYSHRFVTLLYAGWALICLALAILFVMGPEILEKWVVIGAGSGALAMWGLVRRQERMRLRPARALPAQTSGSVPEEEKVLPFIGNKSDSSGHRRVNE